MRNKGKRVLLALLLLTAALLLSGCVSGVEIKGATLDNAPATGTLVLHVQKDNGSISRKMPYKVEIKSGSTITLKRTDGSGQDVVLRNPKIENIDDQTGTMDVCFAYDGLEPGKYQIAENESGYIDGLIITMWIKGNDPEESDASVSFLDRTSGAAQYVITVATPTPTPTATPKPTPTATPVPTAVPDTEIQMRGSTVYTENMAQENLILHIGEGISGFDASFFKSVSIDGTLLDSADYNVANGSILLTVHKDYLNQLKPGNHTVSVALQGGAYNGRVLTAEIRVNPKPNPSNLPETGDGSSPALWLAACLGCAAAALLLKKRRA